MITYCDDPGGLTAAQLNGFFEGWPTPPSPDTHLRLLQRSDYVVLAFDTEGERVVGFVTAVSDDMLSAYIPLLEVLPAFRHRGIASELMRRLLARLDAAGLYMIDLICDAELRPFYERFGMRPSTGMSLRNVARLADKQAPEG